MCIRDSNGTYPEILSRPDRGAEKAVRRPLRPLYGPVSYTHLDVYKRQIQTGKVIAVNGTAVHAQIQEFMGTDVQR